MSLPADAHIGEVSLTVRDLEQSRAFYQNVLGFQVISRTETPTKAAVLARDQVQIRLAENGGDPTQVFYVVAPDGLCYWFGERQPG